MPSSSIASKRIVRARSSSPASKASSISAATLRLVKTFLILGMDLLKSSAEPPAKTRNASRIALFF